MERFLLVLMALTLHTPVKLYATCIQPSPGHDAAQRSAPSPFRSTSPEAWQAEMQRRERAQAIEEAVAEARKEVEAENVKKIAQALQKDREERARSMLQTTSFSVEKIAEFCTLTLQEIEAPAQEAVPSTAANH